MRRDKISLVYFITWLLLSTVVAAKVVRSSSEIQLSAPDKTVNEQLVNKLYARVVKELNMRESEYKGELEELAERKRIVDQQIKEKEQKLSEFQLAADKLTAKIVEAISEEREISSILKGNAALPERRRLEDQLKSTREERVSNERQRDQISAKQLAIRGDIYQLGRYILPNYGAPWNMNPTSVITIPEATQGFQQFLKRVELTSATTKQKYDAWEATKSETSLGALKEHLVNYAVAAAITCNVDISSEKGPQQETFGATVKYQTPTQRRYGQSPMTAKGKTALVGETMPADSYYMWTERQGRATSNRDELFPIGNEREKVILVEN